MAYPTNFTSIPQDPTIVIATSSTTHVSHLNATRSQCKQIFGGFCTVMGLLITTIGALGYDSRHRSDDNTVPVITTATGAAVTLASLLLSGAAKKGVRLASTSISKWISFFHGNTPTAPSKADRLNP